MDALATLWANARVAHLLAIRIMTPVEVGNDWEEGCKTDQDSPLMYTQKVETLEPFSFHMMKMMEAYLGDHLNVMVQALHAQDGTLPPGITMQNMYTELRKGSKKVGKCNTPSWWMELSMVPGKDNTRELTRQVRASFGLPWQLQELDAEKATLQAPPDLPCLHQQTFMLLPDSIFASRDIREVPREKVVAYTRALQYWAEQNDPPTGGESCLLAKGVLELREEVKWYLTFTDEEVFQGVAVLEAYEKKGLTTPSPLMFQRHPLYWNHNPKNELQSSLDGIRYYICLGEWLLLGRSLSQPGLRDQEEDLTRISG